MQYFYAKVLEYLYAKYWSTYMQSTAVLICRVLEYLYAEYWEDYV